MSQQLLETIRAEVLRRLELLMTDMSEGRLDQFHKDVSGFPESYHKGIIELILNQAVKFTNSESEFKRKIRHYYVIEYLHRQRTFQPLVRKVLSWFLVEEIVNASSQPQQLASLMELMCAFEPSAPTEITSCLKEAYERTGQMVISVG